MELERGKLFQSKRPEISKSGKKEASIEATENIEPGEEKVLRAP
jgi:hypothetical protein